MRKFIATFGIILLAGCQIPTGMEEDSPLPPIDEVMSEEPPMDLEITLSDEEIRNSIEEVPLPPTGE
ncbi:hypothetical protein KAI54_01415 [Candidatus Gracilibacteria bacterium]|nr:hypothetical protein [Candidatus Gracilibacteria bacterium]